MADSSSGFITLLLASGMLVTGTINTVATKFQDLQEVKGFGDAPPSAFEHAFFQTACMFVGEFFCFFVYRCSILPIFSTKEEKKEESLETEHASINVSKEGVEMERTKPKQQVNPLLFWIPAFCDLSGTTLLNVGLFLTYASVYQMLRGTLIVFTGLLSIIFLKARLYPHQWGGIILIVVGTILVALSSVLRSDDVPTTGARNPVLGAILVVLAQVLASIQFVVEEKLLKNVDAAPLQVVGWEGFFGLSMATTLLFVLYWVPGSDHHSFENAPFALAQMFNSSALTLGVVGSIVSIAFFNFFGISITKRVSATIRAIIDSARTFCIWLVSLYLEWEVFSWLQCGGFVVLLLGTLVANEVIKIPYYHKWYLVNKKAYEESKKKVAENVQEQTGLLSPKNSEDPAE